MSDADDLEGDSGEEEGGAGWIMTFADLMSLLLAFFVLLFSFSNVDDAKYQQVGGSMKEAFGVQTMYQIFDPVKGVSFIATEFSAGKPDPKTLNVVPQQNFDLEKIEKSALDPEIEKFLKQALVDMEKEHLAGQTEGELLAMAKTKELSEKLIQEIETGALEIETIGNKVVIRITEEHSFPPGSASVLSSFDTLLKKLALSLKGTSGSVSVEGHTDNISIKTPRFRSNWELSASRAVTIAHGLLKVTPDLNRNRLQVRGLGDTTPIADNATPSGRAKNRRVEIVLEYDKFKDIPDEMKKHARDYMKKARDKSRKVTIPSLEQLSESDDSEEYTPSESSPYSEGSGIFGGSVFDL